MAEKSHRWTTIGVTGFSLLNNGMVSREFTGGDGVKASVIVPLESLGPEMVSLRALLATAKEKGLLPEGIGEEMPGTSLMGISGLQIGSRADGKELVLSIVTQDNLHLRFLMDQRLAQTLAEGMIATLAKHGVTISGRPQGPMN